MPEITCDIRKITRNYGKFLDCPGVTELVEYSVSFGNISPLTCSFLKELFANPKERINSHYVREKIEKFHAQLNSLANSVCFKVDTKETVNLILKKLDQLIGNLDLNKFASLIAELKTCSNEMFNKMSKQIIAENKENRGHPCDPPFLKR